MRQLVWVALLLFLALVATAPAAHAERRVALVIGNSAYQHTSKLTNPRNDATDMAAALKKLGFQVIEGLDLDKPAFDRKIRDFAATLKGSDAGVFFYAGHGLQVAGQNYLVPIDSKAEGPEALEFEMVRVDVVHRIMERQTNTNILFLDACRDNPLARNLARSMGTRSSEIGKGLAAVKSGLGTLISFSTQPGNVALDGTGRNSPFAGALVKQLSSANDDLSTMLISVRNDVLRETKKKQVPWEHSALTGRFYFNAAAQTAEPAKPAPARLSEAAEAWDRTKDAASITVLEAFIVRYNDTFYAELARTRIEELKKNRVALAPPPVAKPTLQAPKTATITPGRGIDPVALGMAERQIIDILGEPDNRYKDSYISEYISYRKKGLSILLVEGAAAALFAYSGRLGGTVDETQKWGSYAGAIEGGLGLNSLYPDVISKYGPPDSSSSLTAWPIPSKHISYPKRGISFAFIEKTGEIITITVSVPR